MISFICFGHKNILGTQRNTLEFTKDKELTLDGDCIIGVNSDFRLEEIKRLKGKIIVKIKVNDLIEEVECEVNPEFNDDEEIVIRRTEFLSGRTLGIRANKAAIDLNREMMELMKNPSQKMEVFIHEKTD